jgi:hypothetical protein
MGHHGYVVVDGRISSAHPLGGGLYPTIGDVRDAIRRQKVKYPIIEPHFGGQIPAGWKIRDLTEEEIAVLQTR